MNHDQSKWENTPYNVLGVMHTTLVLLIWRVWACASAIAHLSHPGLQMASQTLKNPPPSTFFRLYCPNEIWHKHKHNARRKSYFVRFRRLQNNVTYIFCKQYFHKQDQAKI